MWFFFPFRVKNPPDRFPYFTLALIAINVLVYVFTASTDLDEGFLSIRKDCLDSLSVTHSNMWRIWPFFTAMFLHASPEHILGNMWFLWLFGPSIEGRLGPLKFLTMYFLSGMVGFLAEDILLQLTEPDISLNVPSLGASGAIMGLCGAYLYTFPYAPFRSFYAYWFGFAWARAGIAEWHARWVVLYYLAYNLISQLLSGFSKGDGVAYMAHVAGMTTGFLFCLAVRVRRDNEAVAVAQAMRVDAHDNYDTLSFGELETLMQGPVVDMRLVVAYCDKAFFVPGGLGEQKCVWAINHYASPLIETADQRRVARLLTSLSLDIAASVPTIFYLRLGSNLERIQDYETAARVYRRLWEIYPGHSDSEIALYRIGRLMEHVYRNPEQARFYYSELIRTFPSGSMVQEAQRSLVALSYADGRYRY